MKRNQKTKQKKPPYKLQDPLRETAKISVKQLYPQFFSLSLFVYVMLLVQRYHPPTRASILLTTPNGGAWFWGSGQAAIFHFHKQLCLDVTQAQPAKPKKNPHVYETKRVTRRFSLLVCFDVRKLICHYLCVCNYCYVPLVFWGFFCNMSFFYLI